MFRWRRRASRGRKCQSLTGNQPRSFKSRINVRPHNSVLHAPSHRVKQMSWSFTNPDSSAAHFSLSHAPTWAFFFFLCDIPLRLNLVIEWTGGEALNIKGQCGYCEASFVWCKIVFYGSTDELSLKYQSAAPTWQMAQTIRLQYNERHR